MRKLFPAIIFIFLSCAAHAQQRPAEIDSATGVYLSVEQWPEFPGGEAALMEFISDNIKFPRAARENNISGKVVVQFVVNEDGSLTDVEVLRDIGGGCADEVVRVVGMMPKWSPGIQDGKIVKVYFMLPVTFKFKEKKEKPIKM